MSTLRVLLAVMLVSLVSGCNSGGFDPRALHLFGSGTSRSGARGSPRAWSRDLSRSAISSLAPVRVWRTVEDVPTDLERTVVTIGNFDGMHLGHQHVVQRTREVAEEVGVDTVVAVTFDPHPIAVLRPEHAPPTLTTIDERLRLLVGAGVDAVLVIPFSRDIAAWSPQEFIDRILVGALHARAVVVGANFRFGHRAAGDRQTLREAGAERDFVLEAVELDGGPQVWSSTYVRTCLAAGDVAGAAEALGRPFVARGVVTEGDKRGRELGYPTANVPVVPGAAAPADGVYAGWLRRLDDADGGVKHPAAISVGTNPTFDGLRDRRVEAYVLDRNDLDLYGVEVEVEFVERIRGMVRFDGIDALMAAIAGDVERTREILGR
jgi:riboflavin kinase/FMN adenylyltransferase